MKEKNWLIRTTQKTILGPLSKKNLIKDIETGKLSEEDEICSGSGHWFWLREKDLMDKYVYGEEVQPFNPVFEAPDILTQPQQDSQTEMTAVGIQIPRELGEESEIDAEEGVGREEQTTLIDLSGEDDGEELELSLEEQGPEKSRSSMPRLSDFKSSPQTKTTTTTAKKVSQRALSKVNKKQERTKSRSVRDDRYLIFLGYFFIALIIGFCMVPQGVYEKAYDKLCLSYCLCSREQFFD